MEENVRFQTDTRQQPASAAALKGQSCREWGHLKKTQGNTGSLLSENIHNAANGTPAQK